MEDDNSIATKVIRRRRKGNPKPVCRVCSKKSKEMINIFDVNPELGVPIADMISQCTEFNILSGDSYPETICPPCLQEATNAFKKKHTHDRNHQFFELLKQGSAPKKYLPEEENSVQVKEEFIENVPEESAPQIEYFQIDEFIPDDVKNEPMDEYFRDELKNEDEAAEEYLPALVMNEPIEDDSLVEDFGESLDYEIDSSYLKGKSYGSDDDNVDEQTTNGNMYTSTKEIQFQCSVCPRLFSTLPQLRIHKYRHQQATFNCSHCQMSFMHQSLLQVHIRKHTGERPFKCHQCNQDFTTKQQFSVHFKSHPQKTLFKCAHCELAFKSQEELDPHIKLHTEKRFFNCPHCQRIFQNQNALTNHVTFTHVKKSSYKCKDCQIDFGSHRLLSKHIKINHTDGTQARRSRKTLLSEQSFNCSYCEKSFVRHHSLALHIKLKHTNPSSVQVFMCSYCKKTFGRNHALVLHIKYKHPEGEI